MTSAFWNLPDQLKLANEISQAVAAEVQEFTDFSGLLATLRTGDEIANAAVTYWGSVGLRSFETLAKVKEL